MRGTRIDAIVAVAHRADEAQRAAYADSIARRAGIVYLEDVPSDERTDRLRNAQIAATWVPKREFPEAAWRDARALRFLQCLAAGADRFPFEWFADDLPVAFNGGASAVPIAEHALAMILAAVKRLPVEHARLAQGIFEQQAAQNRRLRGMKALIVGFGGIGRELGRMLRMLGVEIHAINRSGRTDAAVASCETLEALSELLPRMDIVALTLSLSDRTAGLIGKRELALMKEDAILVNVARGHLVREADLYSHLRSHPRFWACLDAWWIEPLSHGRFADGFAFLELPNVLGSPHNSPIVPGIMVDLAAAAARNIARYLDGEEPLNLARAQEKENLACRQL